MLAKRIIPTLLIRGRQLYKGRQFGSWRSAGLAAQSVKIHQVRGVDELMIFDISATKERRGPDLELIRELGDMCFSPLTVGGGVRSEKDVEDLLRSGADKVAICTAAFDHKRKLIEVCAKRFGCQAIVAVIDYRISNATRQVTTHCGNKISYADPLAMLKIYQDQGAGEVVLQSVDRDGIMSGYDLHLLDQCSWVSKVPLIISGGCGTYQHMLDALKKGADGVAAGALFQWTDCTPRGAAEFLKKHGMEVRLETQIPQPTAGATV